MVLVKKDLLSKIKALFVEKAQGSTNANKTLSTDANGNVILEAKNNHAHDYSVITNKPSYTPTITSSTTGSYKMGSINISGSSVDIYGKDTNTIYTASSTEPKSDYYVGGVVGESTNYARADHRHTKLFNGSTGGVSSATYVNILEIKATSSWNDRPITFTLYRRAKDTPTYISIKLSNTDITQNNYSTENISFKAWGDTSSSLYLRQTSANTWNLIGYKNANDSFQITDVYGGQSGVTITGLNTNFGTTAPSNTTENPVKTPTYIAGATPYGTSAKTVAEGNHTHNYLPTDANGTTTGTLTASKLIKSGGTNTQLLLANGDTKATTDFATSGHNHSGTYVDGVTDKNTTDGSALAEIKANTTVKGTIYHPKPLSSALSTESLYKITANTDGHITKGTSVAIDSTSGGTSGSSSLITSGAVNSGLSGKANSSHPHGNVLNDGTMTTSDTSNVYSYFVGINGSTNKMVKASKLNGSELIDNTSANYTNMGLSANNKTQKEINSAINTALGTKVTAEHTHSSGDIIGLTGNKSVITDSEGILGTVDRPLIFYGTSSTGATAQVKEVTTSTDYVLDTGTVLIIKFTNAQTYNASASNPVRLKVNNSNTNIDVVYMGTTATTRYFWNAGEVVTFIYDGTNFVINKGGLATTTYYGLTKLSSATNSTSTSLAATPSAVNAKVDKTNGASQMTDENASGYTNISSNLTSSSTQTEINSAINSSMAYTTYETEYSSTTLQYDTRLVQFSKHGDWVLVEYTIRGSSSIPNGEKYSTADLRNRYSICEIPEECIPSSDKYQDIRVINGDATDVRLIFSREEINGVLRGRMRVNSSVTNSKKLIFYGSFMYNVNTVTYISGSVE